MSSFEDLVAMLRRFDDEAWAALANKGLLRRARKDLDAQDVVLESEEPTVVRVGAHRITLGPEGPAQAECSCPATTICQHVVTAGLWLVDHTESGQEVPARPPGQTLHDELMAIDPPALTAFGGRAALRWAAGFVYDLDVADVQVVEEPEVQITFGSPRVTFRYMGGGLGGLVPDLRLPAPEKYAVAAVLAYQRGHGAEPVEIAPVEKRETATTRAQAEGRGRFLRAASDLLLDTARLGASHLSPAVHQRYETMAVWAQGAELHRLARLLRRLAD